MLDIKKAGRYPLPEKNYFFQEARKRNSFASPLILSVTHYLVAGGWWLVARKPKYAVEVSGLLLTLPSGWWLVASG